MQAVDRGGDVGGPGPSLCEPEPQAAAAAGEPPGDGEEAAPEACRFPAAGVSGPIAVVAAGLLVGNEKRTGGAFQREVVAFWAVMDELLNAMLFLLIGFQTLAVGVERARLPAVLLCIPFALLARLVSVTVPMLLLGIRAGDRGRGIAVLTWAGLRGGVSIALALGVPPGPYRALVVTGCYAVVVFSIVVQGLSMPRFIRWLGTPPKIVRNRWV